ncbi:hypothetical protein BJV82DRAFT_605451 [Fennellomyces sp. T-0311]|nr:hypothetical protein BJV82DRAFT_605451 [Fennellomyces sp. T-0311]
MRPIGVLWVLVLLIYAINFSTALNKRVLVPDTYTDNTPYQGLPFDSTNVTTPLRTQRDLSLNVTIDRLLWPALDLSSGYFGNDFSAQKLSHFEQVMYMGYRRLVLDLYWDSDKRTWQLCPVHIPSATKRSITSYNASHIVSKVAPATDDVLVGSYKCAPSYTFGHFMDTINNYLVATNAAVMPSETNLLFLVLNLHQLQNGTWGGGVESSLRDIIRSAVDGTDRNTSRLYTPNDLIRDRRNLTDSFGNQGVPYYHPSIDSDTDAWTSASAWPTWLYLIQRDIQLLVGFGYNDLPPNTNYNVTYDQDTIFNATQLGAGWYMNAVNLTDMEAMNWADCAKPSNTTYVSPNGNETAISSAQPNPGDTMLSWSWAYMNDRQGNAFSYNTTLQAVQCGYSPYFTMQNYTHDHATHSPNDTNHLADNVLGTIWTWDLGEPRTLSNPHCAMIQRWNGRWRAGLCTELLRVACRHEKDPNKWILTSTYVSYDRAFSACPNEYVFDCPRVAQQNRVLHQVLEADLVTNGVKDGGVDELLHHLFWINLNSGNSGNCWVVGFSRCWWMDDNGNMFQKLIRTSAVAGVIILIIFVIFVWIKCTRGWRNRKAQKRKNFIKDLLARREYTTVPA